MNQQNTESPSLLGGNIQIFEYQAQPTHGQTDVYNVSFNNNNVVGNEQDGVVASADAQGSNRVLIGGLKERRDICPRAARPMIDMSSIDPMIKRESYANSLRKQRKSNIIASKRLQQQHIQQVRAAALTIRVLSTNIRGINSEKKQQVLAELIERHKPNLVHLQETKLTRRLWISKFQTSQTQLRRNGGSISASSVAGSRPIKALGQAIAWLMMVHQGVPIHAISVYVEPGNTAQADKVYDQTAGINKSLTQRTRFPRIILSGDFNQDRPRYDALAKAFNLNPALPEGTQTLARGGALDQLYTNLDIDSVDVIPLDARITDHSGVLAVLRFNKSDRDYIKAKDLPVRRQWQLKEAAASAVTIKNLLERGSILSEPATSIVHNQVKPQRRVQRWYEAKHLIGGDAQKRGDVTSRLGEDMDRKTWTETMQALEKHHREGAWKEFHHLVRKLTKLKPACSPVTGLIIEDQTLLDPTEVDKHIAEYYVKLYESAMVVDTLQAVACPDAPFSTEEIEEDMANTNFRKGLGPDLFDGRILEQSAELKARVKKELAEMLNNGQLPDYMRDGRLVALSKKTGKSVVELDDIRPIVIRSHLAKIAEKAIKNRN